ncbi:MAG: site-specific integrase [Oscillospiraceae bacterium]|nr:site-specific integrase [Oscillospiraceae bacterium]
MFIDSFIGYLRAEKNCSSHTLRAYAGDLRSFQEYMACLDESLTFFYGRCRCGALLGCCADG